MILAKIKLYLFSRIKRKPFVLASQVFCILQLSFNQFYTWQPLHAFRLHIAFWTISSINVKWLRASHQQQLRLSTTSTLSLILSSFNLNQAGAQTFQQAQNFLRKKGSGSVNRKMYTSRSKWIIINILQQYFWKIHRNVARNVYNRWWRNFKISAGRVLTQSTEGIL